MSKKMYILVAILIVIGAIATTVTLHKTNKAEPESEATKTVTDTSAGKETDEVNDNITDSGSSNLIKSEDLPSNLDVSQRAEYLQQSINYEGITITVEENGFKLSDDFVWSDDTYWFDEDPEGFARYSYLYYPNYGDDEFKITASDSLNKWVGDNTDITYCMAAALDTKEKGTEVTWYVVFRDYPDILVKALYDTGSKEFSYERIF